MKNELGKNDRHRLMSKGKSIKTKQEKLEKLLHLQLAFKLMTYSIKFN